MQEIVRTLRDFIAGNSLQAWVVAALILLVTAVISHLVTLLIRHILRTDGSPLPSSTIIVNVARVCVWVLGFSIMLPACFNIQMTGVIAALGVGGIAVSLGLQDTIKNFFGGLQVTLLKIVAPGDHVIIGSTEGFVKDVSWRQTLVEDFEKSIHIIPNAQINSSEVTRIEPDTLVCTTLQITFDKGDLDERLCEMEQAAKQAVLKVAALRKDPWMLVTGISEGVAAVKLRFVLESGERVREARDAALRAIIPLTVEGGGKPKGHDCPGLHGDGKQGDSASRD